jgi:hypothetical protein
MLADLVDAEVYIWIAPIEWLRRDLWDYETFVREKVRFWVGKDYDPGRYEEEYKGPETTNGTEAAVDEDVVSQRKARRASQEYTNSNSGY